MEGDSNVYCVAS